MHTAWQGSVGFCLVTPAQCQRDWRLVRVGCQAIRSRHRSATLVKLVKSEADMDKKDRPFLRVIRGVSKKKSKMAENADQLATHGPDLLKQDQLQSEQPTSEQANVDKSTDTKSQASAADAHATPKRGIFLLPNLITTGALFAGFYAIVSTMTGQVLPACVAIFIAMLLDGMDGRVARVTGTESEFGAQYDSLSDLVAFGVAPALVAFSWGLSVLGQLGWVAAFVFMACAALRLARFNTEPEQENFVGLASPAAAGLVVFGVWTCMTQGYVTPPIWLAICLALGTAGAGLLMVSNYVYFSPKKMHLRERIPFVSMVLIALGFAVVMVDPPLVLLSIGVLYAVSGPIQHWFRSN